MKRYLPEENYYRTLENDFGVFFWNPPSFLSNFTWITFTYNGIKFECSEQAIMYCKAMLFNDTISAKKIMDSKDPKEHKNLGRHVANYDEETWRNHIETEIIVILMCKFSQNELYKKALIETYPKNLYESSPRDLIWGTGKTPEQSVKYLDDTTFKGKNFLGKSLMKVRESLMSLNNMEFISDDDLIMVKDFVIRHLNSVHTENDHIDKISVLKNFDKVCESKRVKEIRDFIKNIFTYDDYNFSKMCGTCFDLIIEIFIDGNIELMKKFHNIKDIDDALEAGELKMVEIFVIGDCSPYDPETYFT